MSILVIVTTLGFELIKTFNKENFGSVNSLIHNHLPAGVIQP